MAVLVMCCTVVIHIAAVDESPEAQRRGDPNSNRVSSDDAKTVEKQSLLHRGRRAVNKNATPKLSDFEKRLKAMEERYAV